MRLNLRTLTTVALLICAVTSPEAAPGETGSDIGDLLGSYTANPCMDKVVGAYSLLPRYWKDNKLDSINDVLVHMDDNCLPSIRLDYFRTLLAIRLGDFREDLFDQRDYIGGEWLNGPRLGSRYLHFLLHYGLPDPTYPPEPEDSNPTPLQTAAVEFEAFLKTWTERMKTETPESDVEYAVLACLNGEYGEIGRRLRDGDYEGTELSRLLRRKREWILDQVRNPEAELILGGGVSRATGDLAELGEWAYLNLGLTASQNSLPCFGIDIRARFRTSGADLVAGYAGGQKSTGRLTGGSLIGKIGARLLHSERLRTYGWIGGGWDHLAPGEGDTEDDNWENSNTWLIHVGVRQLIRMGSSRKLALSIDLGYDILHHDPDNYGTSLHGNAFYVGISIGYAPYSGYYLTSAERQLLDL